MLTTFFVINALPSGTGSFKAAIDAANVNVTDHDTIDFSGLTPGSVIVVNSSFPRILGPVTIAGDTIAGYAGTPLVEIRGPGMSLPPYGLWFDAESDSIGSSVRGVAVTNFIFDGIRFDDGHSLDVTESYLGLDLAGNSLGNGSDGIEYAGSATSGTLTNNVISGNIGAGVRIRPNALSPDISANMIGTDPTGMFARPNINGGIHMQFPPVVSVGPGNVISGNGGAGITISQLVFAGASITNNLIGVAADGVTALRNTGPTGHGIRIISSRSIMISDNTISGNAQEGITITGDNSFGLNIRDNNIGVGQDGSTAVANMGNGIEIALEANSNLVFQNTIGNNNGNGIEVTGSAYNNSLFSNTIANNVGNGIVLSEITHDNSVSGNTVVDNGVNGILLTGSANSTWVSQNTVASNGSAGIAVTTTTAGVDNRFTQNAIYSNGGLGIDLGIQDEVQANDNLDADTGPNDLQNFPVITSAIRNPVTGDTTIRGTLSSSAFGDFDVELFASDAADPLGHGEGQSFLVGFEVLTDASGDSPEFLQFVPALSAGQFIAATAAVDLVSSVRGSTSEFSMAVQIVDDEAPRVQNVLVSNTGSVHDPHDFSEHDGSGDQIKSTQVGRGINQIDVVFSEDVDVDINDLTLFRDGGVDGARVHVPTFFDYDDSTFTATWRFTTTEWFNSIVADQLLLVLNADGADPIVDDSGIPLDGEWNNPSSISDPSGFSTFPSGDGTFGGDFKFRMTVLLGDANLDNSVDPADYTIWANNFGTGTTFVQGDFNGDGLVGAADYTVWANFFGINWPTWPPGGGGFAPLMEGNGALGAQAALDAVFALYQSDALALEAEVGQSASTPLWEADAETFFDWGPKEINLEGLDGFLAELEAFLVPTV